MTAGLQRLLRESRSAPPARFTLVGCHLLGWGELSHAAIADLTGLSPRAVRRALRDLVELGEVHVTSRRGRAAIYYPAGEGVPTPDPQAGVTPDPQAAPTPDPQAGVEPPTPAQNALPVRVVRPVGPRSSWPRPTAPQTPLVGVEVDISTLWDLATPQPIAALGANESAATPRARMPRAPASTREAEERVFAAWLESVQRTSRTLLSPKRRALIARALRLGYDEADLVDAVRGWRWFPHNRGETNGTTYNDLGLLLRDAEHIEQFRDAERDPAARPDESKARRYSARGSVDSDVARIKGLQRKGHAA